MSAPAAAAAAGAREADPSSVGMMAVAFFVGRTELLEWLNRSLCLSLSRIEQCASGCVYLQALDCLFGSKSRVAMAKVKWGARYDYEFIHNYKLLQAAFDAHDIHKYIEVNKLIKGRYQDNLEFLQWFKAFCDRQQPLFAQDNQNYDPIERRRLGVGPFPSWAPVGPPIKKPAAAAAAAAAGGAAFAASTAASTGAAAVSVSARCRVQQQQKPTATTAAAAAPLSKRQHVLQQQQGQQQAAAAAAAAVETLQGELQQAVLERDFYYSKLRRIEILCLGPGRDSLTVQQLQEILYAKEEQTDAAAAAAAAAASAAAPPQ